MDPHAYVDAHPAPSTFDLDLLPPIAGAQDDPVLDILRAARRRYHKGATAGEYLSERRSNGRRYVARVCAGGALMAADPKVRRAYRDVGGAAEVFEEYAREATKEALRLVNESAMALYGDEHRLDYSKSSYPFGAIEVINEGTDQINGIFEERKAMVLRCYDHAIALRSGAEVAA